MPDREVSSGLDLRAGKQKALTYRAFQGKVDACSRQALILS